MFFYSLSYFFLFGSLSTPSVYHDDPYFAIKGVGGVDGQILLLE